MFRLECMPFVLMLVGLVGVVLGAAGLEPKYSPVAFASAPDGNDCAVLAQWGTADSNAAEAMGWQTDSTSPLWCCEPGAQGVGCDSNGQRVISLDLSGQGIQGTLVARLRFVPPSRALMLISPW